MNSIDRHEIKQQIRLPFVKAVEIAWKNIRVRWWRSILVTSGIVLALAFMTYILASENILRHLPAAVTAAFTAAPAAGGAPLETWWMVGLALLISFVGILNAMLMSVTERFSEIGTMKCLGALDSFIIKLFLLESAFQGLVGTAFGILIGALLALGEGLAVYGQTAFTHQLLLSLARALGYCLLTGVGLTVAGALYPAWRAAKMQPVDAMRWEV